MDENMKIEEQVTSLELSKKLKELGVKQESLFYWVNGSFYGNEDGEYTEYYKEEEYRIYYQNELGDGDEMDKSEFDLVSAFTVSELLELLPQTVVKDSVTYQIFVSAGLDKQFFVVYANEKDYHDNFEAPIIMRHNLCESLARMLIFLIENKYVETNK